MSESDSLPAGCRNLGGDQLDLQVRPFIDGRACESDSTQRLMKHAPATGQPLLQFGMGTARDVDRAVSAARNAFDDGRWSDRSPSFRRDALFKLADLLDTHADELALMECLEVGKPLREARSIDCTLASAVLRTSAESAQQIFGTTVPSDGRSLGLTTRSPRGVVAAIVGWNFPLVLAAMKVGPALATGNTLVLKPSELSSLSALRLARLALDAGVPEGVLNVVPGAGAVVGDALARHPDVDLLTFTGSTHTGRRLMHAIGESSLKPVLLECGGKSPNIVFDDCPDLDAVADAVTARMFWNQGQVCTAGTRLLVQRNIKDALLEKVLARAAALQPGDPFEASTACGPLISRAQLDKVLGYVQDGLAEGAKLVLGGERTLLDTGGYYVQTTVFDEVLPRMRIAREEIFGPVLCVMTFEDEQEALSIANATMYGLSATVWTRSLTRAHKMLRGLRAGEIEIYASAQPSAGPAFASMPVEPHKQSGIGAEGGMEGLRHYTALRSARLFCD